MRKFLKENGFTLFKDELSDGQFWEKKTDNGIVFQCDMDFSHFIVVENGVPNHVPPVKWMDMVEGVY